MCPAYLKFLVSESYCQFPISAAFGFHSALGFSFEFQLALAAFRDVAVLAEYHSVKRGHDALEK